MLKPIIAALCGMVIASAITITPINAPSAMAADVAKYELNVKLVPTAALLARVPTASVLDFPASKVEGHSDFASKSECDAHFEMADIPGIAIAMFQTQGLKYNEDFTIEHECVVKGQDI